MAGLILRGAREQHVLLAAGQYDAARYREGDLLETARASRGKHGAFKQVGTGGFAPVPRINLAAECNRTGKVHLERETRQYLTARRRRDGLPVGCRVGDAEGGDGAASVPARVG